MHASRFTVVASIPLRVGPDRRRWGQRGACSSLGPKASCRPSGAVSHRPHRWVPAPAAQPWERCQPGELQQSLFFPSSFPSFKCVALLLSLSVLLCLGAHQHGVSAGRHASILPGHVHACGVGRHWCSDQTSCEAYGHADDCCWNWSRYWIRSSK